MGFGDGCECTQHLLPSSAHSCFSAPSSDLGSSCKPIAENYQAPNIVILMVWFGVSAGVLAQEMNMILV